MGQKVNPNGLRFGVNRNWESRWVANSDEQMCLWLIQDEKIRKHINAQFKSAQIVRIEIERTQSKVNVFVHAGQPALIIGKESANINAVKLAINKMIGRKINVAITVIPVENVNLSAKVVAREIADAIENRVSFRSAQKAAIKKVLASRAKGIKTNVSGRLGGVEMAREEGYSKGVIPLSTIRADIDYAIEEAHTTYGVIGVKVWINRGEVFGKNLKTERPKKPGFKNQKPGFRKPFKPNTAHRTEAKGA